MKLNKDGSERRKGSGRTKGAKSLVSVKLSDLTAKFTDTDMITVGAVFARKAGLTETAPAISAPVAEEVKAGISIVEV